MKKYGQSTVHAVHAIILRTGLQMASNYLVLHPKKDSELSVKVKKAELIVGELHIERVYRVCPLV